MKPDFDIIGIGIGPFNLSLAALLSQVPQVRSKFFDQKPRFTWHSEIMFRDSVMQTSFLKDLVTPVDPTNPHSFLNYLVQHGLFYAHMNTSRSQISRREFEIYCQWVCTNLPTQIQFNTSVSDVSFHEGLFHVKANGENFTSKNICIGTGSSPWLPESAKPFLGEDCFHAKSSQIAPTDLTGKRLVIIGGGQTGLEIFRNAFNEKWGKARSVHLVSRRHTLEPLDESPFTNEYFTPSYVRDFYQIDASIKSGIVHHQRFASDGNTPFYLQELYNELYQLKHVEKKGEAVKIFPQRRYIDMDKTERGYHLSLLNTFTGSTETMEADVVIFSTGFRNLIPSCLSPLRPLIRYDKEGRFHLSENFSVDWEHGPTHKIYALNFGRHTHGIAEPQTSLMAWRSGRIINDLLGHDFYGGMKSVDNFTQHGNIL